MKLMISLGLLGLVFANASWAKMNLKPGIWEIKSTMTLDGKKMDPQAELKKAMADLPPEQQKMMKEMIDTMAKEKGVRHGGDGMQLCLDEKALNSPKSLVGNEDNQDCDYKIDDKDPKNISMSFTCKDGSHGQGSWNLSSETEYKGKMDVESKDHKKSSMDYKAKFVSADCKGLKPISSQPKK